MPVMLPTIVLPGGGRLFEADVVRGDEVQERRRGMGADQGGRSRRLTDCDLMYSLLSSPG